MPAIEREASRDRDAVARHQHSFSESGRSSVPMWDSSDPDRAPPPLPLNPGNGSPTTKANTSAGIAAAAKQIVEKARESAPLSSYTSNQAFQSSPERSLVISNHHKRLQALQTTSVKDLRSYIDSNRSPERSPERPDSRSSFQSYRKSVSIEDFGQSLDRSSTPTPMPKDPLRDTPALRPTTRPPPRPLLGENTPPSATMLALQTMQVPELPLSDVTNGSSFSSGTRVHTNYDFANQLTNLTTIATNLQKEMANLSRRSKDNATDLVKLQQATQTRDEDIRQSIKELHTTVNSSQNLLTAPPSSSNLPRSASTFSPTHYLDLKPFSTPPSASKSYTLPRAASAHSFLEEPRVGSPSPYSVEGAASVAMLEKIIREMNTKEGQDRLFGTLSDMLEKTRKDNVEASKKIEELTEFIKDKSQSHALVPVRHADSGAPQLDLNFDSPRGMNKAQNNFQSPSDQSIQEVLRTLQRIKDSLAHAGGTSSEVKGLVRDLRGEVLGMGRELGKKLDQVAQPQPSAERSIDRDMGAQHAEKVQRIVEEGLAELKEHMTRTIQDRASQDSDVSRQLATIQSGPSQDDMLAVVQHALNEHSRSMNESPAQPASVDRDGVLAAVKDGLKDFEPNIELQQFGLERDEILAVLKEGLEDYQNNRPAPIAATIDKGEIFEVMQEALKDFKTPMPAEDVEQMKQDILSAVRQALDDPSVQRSGSSTDAEAIHAAVIDAVRDGLASSPAAGPRELAISRDDLFDAVKASLDGSSIPFGGLGDQVLSQLNGLFDNMRQEFHQYSTANGRDTEQVLDAIGDGLEKLRGEVESYVDRVQDVTGRDEIMDTIKTGLDQLRVDVQGYCAGALSQPQGNSEMLDYIRSEFEQLHSTLADQQTDRGLDESKASSSAEILRIIRDGMSAMRHSDTRSLDEHSMDDMSEAMRMEFDQLKTAILQANATDKGELIETIQDSLGAMHARLGGSEISTFSGLSDEVIGVLREEMTTIKEIIHDKLSDIDRDAIVTGIRNSINDLRVQLSADNSDNSAEALGAIKEELDRFRESMGSAVVLGGGSSADHTQVLEAIRSNLEDVKHTTSRDVYGGMSDEQLEAIRGEFENLRASFSRGMVHGGSDAEVLDSIRIGLDDLRSHIEHKFDLPDSSRSRDNDMLDALNDGLETLRTDVLKALDKPLDMTLNYEILDTVKDSMADLRVQMEKLISGSAHAKTTTSSEVVLAEVDADQDRGVNESSTAAPTSIKDMQVMLAQLQIKIEAMDRTLQDMPSVGFANSGDNQEAKQDLTRIESMMQEIQDHIAQVAAAAGPAPESAARKEDTDAIETLLRNTKAQIEDIAPGVTQEHVDDIQAAIHLTNEVVTQLADKVETSVASKGDVTVVEMLAHDLKSTLDELKDKPDGITKLDLDVIGMLVTEVKTKINEMLPGESAELPSKSDLDQLHVLLSDFRDSHDKLRDSYETDIAVTAKAFDDRRQESEDVLTSLTEVKTILTDVRIDLVDKVMGGETGLNAMSDILKTLEERTSNEAVVLEVRDVMEKVKEEFERAHGSIDSMKADHVLSTEAGFEKQVEHKDAIILELSTKVESLFDGLMSKYDDAQLAAESKAKSMEEQATQQQELFENTRVMTEELKLSIDTLGTALTNFMGDLPATVEKMAEESKTVFAQVEQTHQKLEETTSGLFGEHQATRSELSRVLAAIDGVQGDLTEHHPRFMVTLEEVRALIGQHYEHSQKTATAADDHMRAVRELQDQLKAGFEAQSDGFKSQNEELKTALPALMPPPVEAPVVADKYDDTEIHSKLDTLMDHVKDATQRSSQLERLDEIHERVMATAAEVSAFVSAQNKQITEAHESREKDAEELGLLLERRLERKDQLEADITVLNEEKESLQHAIEALRAEKEALTAQKTRIHADVSSLETALHIRRDELHAMDERAATIEKRILDGVMNQQRALLLSKANSTPVPAPKKKPAFQGRDLRVPSDGSAISANTVTSSVRANHALAMKSRQVPNSAERRIMSLNQINHNAVSAAPRANKASLITNSASNHGPQGMKRSHSVKTTPFTAWGKHQRASLSAQPRSYNKENETLSEEEEDLDGGNVDEQHSEAGTERHHRIPHDRRISYLTTTDDGANSLAYASTDGFEPSTITDEPGSRRVSYSGQSEMTYDSRSYLGRDSEISHRSEQDLSGDEHDGYEGQEEQRDVLRIEAPPPKLEKERRVWAPPSDSGIGSDLPTALAGSTGDYFK